MDPFCHSDDVHVDVGDDAALLVESSLQVQCAGLGLLELIAEIIVGLLYILPNSKQNPRTGEALNHAASNCGPEIVIDMVLIWSREVLAPS